ncbi:ATP-binding protein [Sediminibacterium sp. C3]|uniref:methylation-associated defense system ATP-binding protein MAD8 n=1 Tax=Sediminibacterium sp. C3 TaxID=1267211 RepID=UPI000402C7BD|nr:ATP-binding protein [Sediminibacterium sp. C3]
MNTSISLYFQEIIDLLLELNSVELANAKPGHCMKITGFGEAELNYILEMVRKTYPLIDSFIISDDQSSSNHISASKLIELRNKEEKPLLILIPASSRTAAEDSYGNNTFKDLSLDDIEARLKNKMLSQVPEEWYSNVVFILKSFEKQANALSKAIKYLLEIKKQGFTPESIGNNLYFFGLIPDSKLFAIELQTKARLNFNMHCSSLMATFNKPTYDRISEMPIEPNSIQPSIVNFLKAESGVRNASQLFQEILENYSELNFCNWPIPELDTKRIKLFTTEVSSTDFKLEEGTKVLHANSLRASKVKIKFNTHPNPTEIPELRSFRIILMRVTGGAGEEVIVLKKIKNTTSGRSYREASVELHPNVVEEGSYFFKVYAEDEHGNVLNADDEFKEASIQMEWERQKAENPDLPKSSFDFKLTCDSDDFHFQVEEGEELLDNIRKDKIHNVTEAYFKFRIEDLRKGIRLQSPVPTEDSNVWHDAPKPKQLATFHIAYNTRHNYQVNIPSKLRELEWIFLNHANQIGTVVCEVSMNPSEIAFPSSSFRPSVLNSIVDTEIILLRQQLFKSILQSNIAGNGIVETTNLVNLRNQIEAYILSWSSWVAQLNSKLGDKLISNEEREELQRFLAELQFSDLIKLKTNLPDGTPIEALLLSPIHPLRLSWFIQLIDVYNEWELKTIEFPGYQKDWFKGLTDLFEGELYPENNPLVIVEPNSLKNYHYAGELMQSWGIYLASPIDNSSINSTSIDRQLTQYFRLLLNVTRENFVDNDVNLKLVVRQIKNYRAQHPYTDKLVLNIFNAGDAFIFADAFVELESESDFENVKYEVRIFRGPDRIIEHGEGLKNLLNPESNIRDEAESFAQPSDNRLFPKLRFSINMIEEYIRQPHLFTSHISFFISPFPVRVELFKPNQPSRCFFLNGLITDSTLNVSTANDETKWNRYILASNLSSWKNELSNAAGLLFDCLQSFTAGTLASRPSDSLPSTQITLNALDKVLLAHLHNHSDWVITYDRNLGPEVFDIPSKDNSIPFLLDYIPGDEVSGISSFLTTRPTSEVLALLGPHFQEFGLNIDNESDSRTIHQLLEDLRAVSSSLILQLNSTKNKAFEVIGSAFTKRVLEKKGLLQDSFLIPIDLHQDLFNDLPTETKSRADNLLVSIDCEKRQISVTVIEVKCRKALTESERSEIKLKMRQQILNTIEAIRSHYDPEYHLSFDRLDREIKNKELKSLLSFYLDRASRYEYLSDKAYGAYNDFLQKLDEGFTFKFQQLGLIFELGFPKRHLKESIDTDCTFFTFGERVIRDILDPDSDLNTRRLEEKILDDELSEAVGINQKLRAFIQQFKIESKKTSIPSDSENTKSGDTTKNTDYKVPDISTNDKPISPLADKNRQQKDEEDEGGIIDNSNKPIDVPPIAPANIIEHEVPEYDVMIGKNGDSPQFGILGKTVTGKSIAVDLSETNTISLFGVQGGGKSYTIGTVTEMVLKPFNKVNKIQAPLACVIFHYSESMDYEPEFTSMIYPNDKEAELRKLKQEFGAEPGRIEDVVLLTPKDKVEARKAEYPSIDIFPIAFNSKELNVQDWMFLLGAIGNDSTYIKQLKAIMKDQRNNLSLGQIGLSVEISELLSNSQKALAKQKLSFAREYIDDSVYLRDQLKPGRLIIVDLRDEFIVKDEALGLFVIMLNIFSGVKNWNGVHFNKFIVFDEAHKYMDNKDLTGNIVTAIREMRHKGVSIMIASQDPPSLPNEIIELSSIVLLHKFNSPQWLKHIQKSVTQLSVLTPVDMSALMPGEGFLWSSKATDKAVTVKPVKISTRPRVTKHGGGTIQAIGH